MSDTATRNPPVLVDYLKFIDGGEPYLEGTKCTKCGTHYLGPRMACSKCFARADKLETVALPTTGALHSWTTVYRSYPGIPVPFVSATVDLDGACSIKGTLIDVDPDPEKLESGLRVNVIFKELDYKDKEGAPFVSFFFSPAT
jgi:uncharacterized OB-fold protein